MDPFRFHSGHSYYPADWQAAAEESAGASDRAIPEASASAPHDYSHHGHADYSYYPPEWRAAAGESAESYYPADWQAVAGEPAESSQRAIPEASSSPHRGYGHYGHSGHSYYPADWQAVAGEPAESSQRAIPGASSSGVADHGQGAFIHPAGGSHGPFEAAEAAETSQVGLESTGETGAPPSGVWVTGIGEDGRSSSARLHWLDGYGIERSVHLPPNAAQLLQVLSSTPNVLFSRTALRRFLGSNFAITTAAREVRRPLAIAGFDLLSIRHPSDDEAGYMLRTQPLQPIVSDNGITLTAYTISHTDQQRRTKELMLTADQVNLLDKLYHAGSEGVLSKELQRCLPPTKKTVGDWIGEVRVKLKSFPVSIERRMTPETAPGGIYSIRWGN